MVENLQIKPMHVTVMSSVFEYTRECFFGNIGNIDSSFSLIHLFIKILRLKEYLNM